MGAPVEARHIRNEAEAFKVWPINWDSVIAFLGCQTQWITTTVGKAVSWSGINYPSLEVVMKRYGSPEHAFDDVQYMEREALKVFAEASR